MISINFYVPMTGFAIWDLVLSFLVIYITLAVAARLIRALFGLSIG